MNKTQESIEDSSQWLVPNYGRFAIAPERGAGTELWDRDGKRYLDFGSGVAVCSLGHCHPAMIDAIGKQASTLIHCSNLYHVEQQNVLARLLTETVMQQPGRCFFCNSGTEANEALIKLAKRYGQGFATPRTRILTFTKGFHGRTTGGMSATAQEKIRQGFGSLLAGFEYLPFNDVDALEEAMDDTVAAVLLEPVQGEGGVHIATPKFLKAARELTLQHGALLFFDEVQSGMGRCGDLAGWRAIPGVGSDIVPDGVSWAKGLGGGFPIGAIWIANREVDSNDGAQSLSLLLGPGTHGSTFGGSPLACAVAMTVVRTIIMENLCAHATTLGTKIVEEIQSWRHHAIRDVRGLGFLIGIELNVAAMEPSTLWKSSGKTPAIWVVSALAEKGLLTVPAGPDVVRLLPPLVVTEAEAIEALGILRDVLFDLLPSNFLIA
jgi:acetylornithine/N-succinyldiaminopimelate aminotransferase